MKKDPAHKTNTFRVQSQMGKMKRFLQEILRGDLFTQVCKQVKEQPGRRLQSYSAELGEKNHWAAQDSTQAVKHSLPAQEPQGRPTKELERKTANIRL